MNCDQRSRRGDGRRLAAIFAFLLLAAQSFASPALASSFQVDPIGIELAPGQRTATLSVRNTDAKPASIRVMIYRWTQQNGEDLYSETTDLIASPPIFTVAPSATQLVRIGPRNGLATGAYRVILEEIPDGDENGISVALRINLPFYIVDAASSAPQLSWSAWRSSEGDLVLEARNSGSRHSQIVELASVDAAGTAAILTSEMGVVLPGSARRWNAGPHPELATGSVLQLQIRNGRGEITQNAVTLDQR